MVGAKILQKMWEGPCWEGVWPSLDPWDVVGLRTTASVWKVPGKYGPHGELFFFLIEKEPFALTKAEFRPCVGDATSKACALIGLHAEEATSLSLSGCLRSWVECGGVAVQGSLCGRATFAIAQRASVHLPVRCMNAALTVALLTSLGRTGQAWWCLSSLGDSELARVALSCHMALAFVPRHERCVPGKLTVTVFTVYGRLSHRVTAVTVWRFSVVRDKYRYHKDTTS